MESLQGVQQSWELRVHEYQHDHALEDPVVAASCLLGACPHWDEWNPAPILANTARFNSHAAAIRTLRQPPSPEGEREGLEESPATS